MAMVRPMAKAMARARAKAKAKVKATTEEKGTVAGAVEGEFIMGREGITFKHSFIEMTSRLNYKDNTESLKNPIKRNS